MAHSADHRRALTVSDRLISSLARASARKRAYKADETSAETSTEHVVQAHMMRLPPVAVRWEAGGHVYLCTGPVQPRGRLWPSLRHNG